MRLIWNLIKIAFWAAVLGFFLKVYGAKWLLTFYLQKELGTRVTVQDVRLDFVNTQAKFRGLMIQNPLVYPEGVMIAVSDLFLDFEPRSLLKGKPGFSAVDLNAEEIRVLNVPGNGLNLRALTILKPQYRDVGKDGLPRYETDPKADFSTQKFYLTAERATYTDLTGPNPVQKSYALGLRHAEFNDLEGLRGLTETLVRETLNRIGLRE